MPRPCCRLVQHPFETGKFPVGQKPLALPFRVLDDRAAEVAPLRHYAPASASRYSSDSVRITRFAMLRVPHNRPMMLTATRPLGRCQVRQGGRSCEDTRQSDIPPETISARDPHPGRRLAQAGPVARQRTATTRMAHQDCIAPALGLSVLPVGAGGTTAPPSGSCMDPAATSLRTRKPTHLESLGSSSI